MTNLQKIRIIIELSDLPKSDQIEFIALFFLNIEDKKLKTIFDLFNEYPEWIKKIYDNYKIKKLAIKEENQNLWNWILKNEKNQLNIK